MKFVRTGGLLLHVTSLPGGQGIGDLGDEAYHFVDFLEASGLKLWQMMPLGPTGYGDSPYATFSASAGNPLLISLDRLVKEGFLTAHDLAVAPPAALDRVDYGQVLSYKLPALRHAYSRFQEVATSSQKKEFEQFCKEQRSWLEDYTLFTALKAAHKGAVWNSWEAGLAKRDQAALKEARKAMKEEIGAQSWIQQQFFKQWGDLRRYANEHGVQIIGDLPIFVAFDSADTWANPEQFYINSDGQPTLIAGVPPDYFSATGQLWGNPLYRWDTIAATGYKWWIARLRQSLHLFDIIRLDHFRGFEAYYAIPATATTAVHGTWEPGPGAALFQAIETALGPLPIIAEDLGVITPEVVALRDRFDFPGMKILQFAFGTDGMDPFLPHNYLSNCVVYTGSHDNDTTVGWYASAPEKERDFARRYMQVSGRNFAWNLIRLAFSSVAVMAVVPLQDVLSLDSHARMNFPGKALGNWTWRMRSEALNSSVSNRLLELVWLYGRQGKVSPEHGEDNIKMDNLGGSSAAEK